MAKTINVILQAFGDRLTSNAMEIEDTKDSRDELTINFYGIPILITPDNCNVGTIHRQWIEAPRYGVFKYYGCKNKKGLKIYGLVEIVNPNKQ